MTDSQQRLTGESQKAYQAYLDYRDMGLSGSLRKLHTRYQTASAPPTTRLRTLENWSARHNWQDRVAAWHKHLQSERDQAAEEARIAERELRSKLLAAMSTTLIKAIQAARPDNIGEVTKLFRSFSTYMEQSRREHNDLPTERTDITSGDEALNVVFTTEPIPEDVIKQYLEKLDLAEMVNQHTE